MSETKHKPFVRWVFAPEDHGYWILESVACSGKRITLLTVSEEFGHLTEDTRNKIASFANANPKVEELVELVKNTVAHPFWTNDEKQYVTIREDEWKPIQSTASEVKAEREKDSRPSQASLRRR